MYLCNTKEKSIHIDHTLSFYSFKITVYFQILGNKAFKCPYCEYSTTDNVSLYSHLTTHSKTKALRCEQCPYTCTWRKQMVRHTQAHTSPDKVECKVCGMVSRDKKQDLVHYSLEHAVITTPTNKHVQSAKSTSTTITTTTTTTSSSSSSTAKTNASQQVMLSDDSVGLSLAQLLTRNPDSSSSVANHIPPASNPKLIISKDDVADNIRVLNVTDLVRHHVKRGARPPLQLGSPKTSNANHPSRGQVSLLKSAVRPDVRRMLQQASASKIIQDSICVSSREHQENGTCEVIPHTTDLQASHDSHLLEQSCDVVAASDVGVIEVDVVDSCQPVTQVVVDQDVRVGNDPLLAVASSADVSATNSISCGLQAVSGFEVSAEPCEVQSLGYSVSELDVMPSCDLDSQIPNDFHDGDEDTANRLSSVNAELHSLLEMFENEEASRRAEAGESEHSANQVSLSRADLSEIIGLIESKINGVETPSLDCSSTSCVSTTAPTEPVQLVLQVNDNAQPCPSQPHSTAAASIELSHLDQILRSLLFNSNGGVETV